MAWKAGVIPRRSLPDVGELNGSRLEVMHTPLNSLRGEEEVHYASRRITIIH